MTTLTEGRYAAEFLMSEANGMRSRESGTVASGQNLVAGQLVKASGANLVAYTDGSTPLGIILDNADATGGALKVAYIARDAEVNTDMLTFPTENSAGTVKTDAIAALADLGIVCR